MAENVDKWESVVARSNLVPTAGEFVPKSQAGLHQTDFENSGNSLHEPGQNSECTSTCYQRDRGYPNEPDGSLAGTSGTSTNSSHSNKFYANNKARYPPEGTSKNVNIFFGDNQEHRYSKFNISKANSRWKKSEFDDVRNRNEKIGMGQNFESWDSQNRYLNRSRHKSKHNEYSYSNSIKSYEKNGTVYFRDDAQYNSFPEHESMSWRRKERFNNNLEQSYFPRNKYKQNGHKGGEMENVTNKKGGSYKNGIKSRYNRDCSFQKNDKVEDFKDKGDNVNEIGEKTSQREHLIDLLTRGVLECLVCCEMIYQNSSVWGCNNCYHIFHLKCIIKWAKTSKSDFGWRCPACQNITIKVPSEYFCFCGKVKDPEWNHHDCPHSCGEVCGKTHRTSCPHKCTLLCHPGPCPQCTATVNKYCGCQRTSKTVQCSSLEVVVCDNVCGKELNCLIHCCAQKCHMEPCEECKEVVAQDCFCGKEHRVVKCTAEVIGVKNFCCGNICNKELSCKNHNCPLLCHEGECQECDKTPALVKYCQCGKTELASLNVEERKSCSDPIPTCDLTCGKILPCSTNSENAHTCQSKCHEGPCPVCPLEMMVKCRCGHMGKMVPCAELNERGDYTRCDKRCSKKRSCGKHKCNQLCCTGVDHECPLPCNRLLQCGLHRCEETCHRGHCKPCLQASFDELSCECGAEVIFPPVPCGTRRPPCNRSCTRTHVCDHPPTHNCHSANQCPPCTVLTKKYCHGRHELRRAVPCHQESFSCGLPCAKEIECGRHKCILPCHSGPCLKEGQSCVQPCAVPRPVCGHICGAPCHEGPCPTDTPCKEMVRVTCECGHRFTTRLCHDNAKEYQRIATVKLATKMADLQAGQSIDLNDVVSASKKLSYKTLECNDECKLIDRNRRLAIALQIRNPDLSAKLTPRYSDYLKNWAKKDSRFCQMVHNKLTDLVQLAKQSKQKSRSYSFDPMNREKRHFVHEYCEHFGCESVAYDQEPKRNVVATALKDKSWLPSISIIEFVQKENSPRKVPVPVIAKTTTSTSQRTMEVLPSKILPNHQSELGEAATGANSSSSESQIDYFDWRPQNS